MNDETILSASDNPEEAQRFVAQALDPAGGGEAPPSPPPATDRLVNLPGGLFHPEYGEITTAEVRELNGADEETISRIPVKDAWRFKDTVLQCGVTKLGEIDNPPAGLLSELCIGDRDTLLLGIRKATYGNTLDMDIQCPSCADEHVVSVDLDEDLPIKQGSTDVSFTLDDGTHVEASVPTGKDENEAMQASARGATGAVINTKMLASCVSGYGDVLWIGESSARALGMKHRGEILKKLTDAQPGPRFEEVTHTCPACGVERPLLITFGDLFRS